MKRVAIPFQFIASLSLAVVTAGFFGKWNWLLDLCSHLRSQAVFALVVCGVLLLALERRRWGVVCLVVALGLTATLWPFYFPSGSATRTGTYRLLSLNVLAINPAKDKVIDFILETDPDFILLQETRASWIESLDEALGETWPYHKSYARLDYFGISIYSKIPWACCELKPFSKLYSTPSLDALIELPDGKRLRLIAVHPISPMNNDKWKSRNLHFEGIAEAVQTPEHGRTIVAGDFNCTPWSYWFRRLIRESGLRDAMEGQGFHVTWLPIPIGIFGLPIDHVLVGPDIQVTGFAVGPYVGSDHRGLVVEFE
ncbi:endonuclease/exonuclease/phosphatase family protein [Bythopirellula goksoeyrii]|uniref:Endonuclease/exonuclease/phosphatase domain-containing protein n=1 Tax=Bythopirellula goksoeyrii TaxID=1400387 RepID=A0A5B9QJF8_9BACT|nr:endonuclease/exonuclease/phosphatase family protein [Bythopirellula goksoeyrii]QEG34301.1 hypothetical protein Pr1d_15750 [Bythopirellula goksoeyrii]